MDPEERPSAEDLLKHPFLQGASQCKGEYATMVDTHVSEVKAYKEQKKAAEKAARREQRQKAKAAAAAAAAG